MVARFFKSTVVLSALVHWWVTCKEQWVTCKEQWVACKYGLEGRIDACGDWCFCTTHATQEIAVAVARIPRR